MKTPQGSNQQNKKDEGNARAIVASALEITSLLPQQQKAILDDLPAEKNASEYLEHLRLAMSLIIKSSQQKHLPIHSPGGTSTEQVATQHLLDEERRRVAELQEKLDNVQREQEKSLKQPSVSEPEGVNTDGQSPPSIPGEHYTPHHWEKVVTSGAAIIILFLALFLVVRNEPFRDPNLVVMTRILLSVCIGAIGAAIPGFLRVGIDARGMAIRAGGALALFVISFLFTPTVLSQQLSNGEEKINNVIERTTGNSHTTEKVK